MKMVVVGIGVSIALTANYLNAFVFGVAVKSRKIAKEVLEEFGDRIKNIYNKQY